MDTSSHGKYHDTVITYQALKDMHKMPQSHADGMALLFHALGNVEYPLDHPTVSPIYCTSGRIFRQKFPVKCILLSWRNLLVSDHKERQTLRLIGVRKRNGWTYDPEALEFLLEAV